MSNAPRRYTAAMPSFNLKTLTALLPIGLLALLSSCAPQRQSVQTQTTTTPTISTQTSSPRELPITVLAQGTQAAYADATSTDTPVHVQLATTPAALNALWHAAYARQSARPALPALSGQTAVGVFMGTRPTGGYGVQVTQASASGDTLLLTVQTHSPTPGMMTTQALTSPWVIVTVPGQYSHVTMQSAADSKR